MSFKDKIRNTLTCLLVSTPLTVPMVIAGVSEYNVCQRVSNERAQVSVMYSGNYFRRFGGQFNSFSIDFDRDGKLDVTRTLIPSRLGFSCVQTYPSQKDQTEYHNLYSQIQAQSHNRGE